MSERQNIEWKQSWQDEYLKWVCAFANTEGGRLIIGKDDNGKVVGLPNYRRLMEDIPGKIKNRMGIICPVNLYEEEGEHYIEIVVHSYSVPISYRGKYYTRSGSTTNELNGVELADFLLHKSGKTWDEIIIEDATMDDIDPDSIAQLVADSQGKGRLPDTSGLSDLEILQKLRLANDDQLKRAAIILFGKDPNKFFPNCKVMIGRFGADAEDLKFHEPLEGNLVYLLNEVQNQLNYKFLTRPVDFAGMMRRENDEYPVAALREILLNALVHKKYMGAAIQIRVFDDRLSIWNEGTLPPGLTVENLKEEHNSKSPNPVLAEACFKAGYIDTWGRGTLKVYKACADANLPEPSIVEKNGGIEVTLYKVDTSEELRRSFGDIAEKITNNLNKNIALLSSEYGTFKEFLQTAQGISSEKLRRNFGKTSEEFRRNFGDKKAVLLFLIALDRTISAKDAAEKIGVSSRSVETYLADLKENQIIDRIGPDKGGHWEIVLKSDE